MLILFERNPLHQRVNPDQLQQRIWVAADVSCCQPIGFEKIPLGVKNPSIVAEIRCYPNLLLYFCCTIYTVNGTTKTGEVRYLPWGGVRFASGQTVTSYKFTGQREKAGIGLYYYGARAQWAPDDPALGRFVQHSRGFLTATDSARDRQHWVDSLTAHRPAASGVPSSAPAASAAPP